MLKPCPFCGGTDIVAMDFWVFCDRCGADGAICDARDGAITAWNKRPDQTVYEIVDVSDAGFSYDLGIFASIDDALAHIAHADGDDHEGGGVVNIECDGDASGDTENLEIHARAIGVGRLPSDRHNVVATITRDRTWAEDRDSSVWSSTVDMAEGS